MIIESEIKKLVTPDIIKKMRELAGGFRYSRDGWSYNGNNGFTVENNIGFPLLIHRAVENLDYVTNYDKEKFWIMTDENEVKIYIFKNYQPENLTALECAMLDCLIEILKGEL